MADGDGGRDRDDNGQRVVPADEVSQIVSNAVNRATAPLKDQIANLESKAANPNPPKEDKVYTRAQLNAAVADERITQAEADAIWDKQQEKRNTDTTIQLINQSRNDDKIQVEIDKYKAFDPDLDERTSDAYTKVALEVQEQCRLLGIQQPTLAVELNALKTIYGPANRLKNPQQKDRQAHQDTVTNDGDDKPKKVEVNDDGSPVGLTKDERAYYQDLINKGIYRDWNDVAKEMGHADQQLRQRTSARN